MWPRIAPILASERYLNYTIEVSFLINLSTSCDHPVLTLYSIIGLLGAHSFGFFLEDCNADFQHYPSSFFLLNLPLNDDQMRTLTLRKIQKAQERLRIFNYTDCQNSQTICCSFIKLLSIMKNRSMAKKNQSMESTTHGMYYCDFVYLLTKKRSWLLKKYIFLIIPVEF